MTTGPRLLTLEHSPTAYRLDFASYAAVSVGLGLWLVMGSPRGSGSGVGVGLGLAAWALAGVAAWTLVEYVLHRFVLHVLPPFKRWHAEHHQRPTALIASPTLLSALLFFSLAFLPAWWLLGAWPAGALTWGLITGYLVYGLIHHATHHAVPGLQLRSAWLSRRRRWHAQHHAAAASDGQQGHYGVSGAMWDHAFGTAQDLTVPVKSAPP